jgi:phage shock protein A
MTPEQAKALRESATNIIAHEKTLEREQEKLAAELENVSKNARQAVMMADEAARDGDAEKAAVFNESAETLATRMVEIDSRTAKIDIELIEARQASAEAKGMASDSAIKMAQMQSKNAELQADLRRAVLAETSLEEDGIPSYDQVRDKIGEKLARAEAEAELSEADGAGELARHTAVVEDAANEAKARARLAELRSSMGVASPEFVETDAADEEPETPNEEE